MAQWEAELRSPPGDRTFSPFHARPLPPACRRCAEPARTENRVDDDDADAEESAIIAKRLGGVDRFD